MIPSINFKNQSVWFKKNNWKIYIFKVFNFYIEELNKLKKDLKKYIKIIY